MSGGDSDGRDGVSAEIGDFRKSRMFRVTMKSAPIHTCAGHEVCADHLSFRRHLPVSIGYYVYA